MGRNTFPIKQSSFFVTSLDPPYNNQNHQHQQQEEYGE